MNRGSGPLRAVIAAAGRGERLDAVTEGKIHKSLLPLGGDTILGLTLRTLHAKGIAPVFVVTGHLAEDVEQAAGSSARTIFNARYADSGILVSLSLAEPFLRGSPFLVIVADHLFDPDIVDFLAAGVGDIVVGVELKECDGEDAKVLLEGGRIVRFGKDLPLDEAHGEFIGMAVFSAAGSSRFFRELGRYLQEGHRQGYMMDIFNRLLADGAEIAHVETRGLPRLDIDFPEDYERARRAVYPSIRDKFAAFPSLPAIS